MLGYVHDIREEAMLVNRKYWDRNARLADEFNEADRYLDQMTQERCYNPEFPLSDPQVARVFRYSPYAGYRMTKYDPD